MPDGKKRLLEFEVRHWHTNRRSPNCTSDFGGGDVPAALGTPVEARRWRAPSAIFSMAPKDIWR